MNLSHPNWENLGAELYKRTVEPAKHPSFVIYFIMAIIIGGGIGFWVELAKYIFVESTNADALRTSVTTFFPVLAATTCLQVIWAEDTRMLRAFVFVPFGFCLLGLIACISDTYIHNAPALIFGSLSSIIALWMWWITNANQKDLMDNIDPNDAVGGKNPNARLSGSLDEFVV